MNEQENINDQAENHEEKNVSEEKSKNAESRAKTYFSWRVYEDEDGGIRSEFYTDPAWKGKHGEGEGPDFERRFGPGMCPPFMIHGMGRGMGRMGKRFAGRMERMGEHMERHGGRMRRRWGKKGQQRTREMLDHIEGMYDEFYGDGPESDEPGPGPEASEA